ncbi:MAG: hypothetical protein ACRDD8_16450 [Bacteroidales bacterium]
MITVKDLVEKSGDMVRVLMIDKQGYFEILEFYKKDNIVEMNATDSSYSPNRLDGINEDHERIEEILYGLDYVKTSDSKEIDEVIENVNRNTVEFVRMNVASDTIAISEIIKEIDKHKGQTIIIKELV